MSLVLSWMVYTFYSAFFFFFFLASTPAPVPVADFVSPPRPNVGGQGRTIQLRANYFQISIPKGFIQHYEVAISPDKCPRRVNRSVGCSLLSMIFDLEQFFLKYWEICARIGKVFMHVWLFKQFLHSL